jgi:hypothetical protein
MERRRGPARRRLLNLGRRSPLIGTSCLRDAGQPVCPLRSAGATFREKGEDEVIKSLGVFHVRHRTTRSCRPSYSCQTGLVTFASQAPDASASTRHHAPTDQTVAERSLIWGAGSTCRRRPGGMSFRKRSTSQSPGPNECRVSQSVAWQAARAYFGACSESARYAPGPAGGLASARRCGGGPLAATDSLAHHWRQHIGRC